MGQNDGANLLILIIIMIVVIFLVYWFLTAVTNNNSCNSGNENSIDIILNGPVQERIKANASKKSYDFWSYISKPYKRISGAKTGLHKRHLGNKTLSQIVGTSNNWSGYVAADNLRNPTTGSATYVKGTFNIPALNSDSTQGNNNVSMWVGIDGAFSSDPSVQQIGIDMFYADRKQQIYTWYEMYPDNAQEISGFPAESGDSITVEVSKNGNSYDMTIYNNSKNVKTTVNGKQSNSAQAQSVEWIVEAPALNDQVVPLSDFGYVAWNDCTATINNKSGSIQDFDYEQINMVSSSNSMKAQTSDLDQGKNFKVQWHNSQ